MARLFLLFVIPVIFAFNAQFKYGCGSETCTYKFVIPEEISEYVDPAMLMGELDILRSTIDILEGLDENMPDANATAFNEAFEPAYNQTQEVVLNVTAGIENQQATFEEALNHSIIASTTANCLAEKTVCFQSGGYSQKCGQLC